MAHRHIRGTVPVKNMLPGMDLPIILVGLELAVRVLQLLWLALQFKGALMD